MTTPAFDPVNPRGQVSLRALDRLAERVEQRDRVAGAVAEGSFGTVFGTGQDDGSFWARISGAPSSSMYPWVAQKFSSNGVPSDDPAGPSGTATVNPAIPVGLFTNVPVGQLVRLYPGTGGTYYSFWWEPPGGGGAAGSLTVEDDDGSPTIGNVNKIQVDQGSSLVITNQGGGVVKLAANWINVPVVTSVG